MRRREETNFEIMCTNSGCDIVPSHGHSVVGVDDHKNFRIGDLHLRPSCQGRSPSLGLVYSESVALLNIMILKLKDMPGGC